MSLHKKIASQVAIERARCAAVLDHIQRQLEADVTRKLLIESDRHIAQTKLKIARAVFSRARVLILTGFEPGVKDDAIRSDRESGSSAPELGEGNDPNGPS